MSGTEASARDYLEAQRRIAEATESRSPILNLDHLTLSTLPPEISGLTWLRVLCLGSQTWSIGADGELIQTGEDRFSFAYRWLTDLSPLSALLDLEILDITLAPNLANFRPLLALRHLRELRLQSCAGIGDLPPLADLPALRHLDLMNSPEHFKKLPELPQLRSLSLSHSRTLTDISPVARLTGLERLDLSTCEALRDLTPLASLSRLRQLDLSDCNVTDISALAAASTLTELDITYCEGLSDLSCLSVLPGLVSLRVGSRVSKDLSPLNSLMQLRSLTLQWGENCSISTICPLLERLEELFLFRSIPSDLPKLVTSYRADDNCVDWVRQHLANPKAKVINPRWAAAPHFESEDFRQLRELIGDGVKQAATRHQREFPNELTTVQLVVELHSDGPNGFQSCGTEGSKELFRLGDLDAAQAWFETLWNRVEECHEYDDRNDLREELFMRTRVAMVLALRDLDRGEFFGTGEQRRRIALHCISYAEEDVDDWFVEESASFLNPAEIFHAFVEKWNESSGTASYPISSDSISKMLNPYLSDE